jgi:hypothetical protein
LDLQHPIAIAYFKCMRVAAQRRVLQLQLLWWLRLPVVPD